jgi:hypothetical protein
MSDLIIVDGDQVTFQPSFNMGTMNVLSGLSTTISGSAANTKVGTKAPCLAGDEKNVQSPGCNYAAPPFSGGTGTLKIDKLNNDQLTQTTEIEGKKVILKGSTFDAVFEVMTPGVASNGSTDTTTKYSGGKGSFTASNQVVFAS